MIIEKLTEVSLIRKARRGDGKALEALIRAHQEALYAFMLRLSGRPDVAEDVTQEAFVRVLSNLDRFDSRFRFSTWLFTIAKRLYVNSIQKLAPRYDSDFVSTRDSLGEPPSRASAQRESFDNMRLALDAALDDLNPQQREIVLLFHQQNWSITAISEHLAMPEGTVKSHLHRARKRMRQFILADARTHSRMLEVLE
jgi:RNA polymerase sigma-70 factor (ECF subfamily)